MSCKYKGILVSLWLTPMACAVDPVDTDYPARASQLSPRSAFLMDEDAAKTPQGRLEKRAILAHFEHQKPQEIDQPGIYMRTYADALMQEDRFFEAGQWFYRSARVGLESAQLIFRDKKIFYTQLDEEACARAFEKHWVDFIG